MGDLSRGLDRAALAAAEQARQAVDGVAPTLVGAGLARGKRMKRVRDFLGPMGYPPEKSAVARGNRC